MSEEDVKTFPRCYSRYRGGASLTVDGLSKRPVTVLCSNKLAYNVPELIKLVTELLEETKRDPNFRTMIAALDPKSATAIAEYRFDSNSFSQLTGDFKTSFDFPDPYPFAGYIRKINKEISGPVKFESFLGGVVDFCLLDFSPLTKNLTLNKFVISCVLTSALWVMAIVFAPAFYFIMVPGFLYGLNKVHKNVNTRLGITSQTVESTAVPKEIPEPEVKVDYSFSDMFNHGEIREGFPLPLRAEVAEILQTVEELWVSNPNVRTVPNDLIEVASLYNKLSAKDKDAKLSDLGWMVEQIKKKADGFAETVNNDSLVNFDVQLQYYKNKVIPDDLRL